MASAETDDVSATATAMLHVRRLISVMVVDSRDFTVLTRQLDETILSEAIGTWLRRAGEILTQYGSGVDKSIGDAVMAVWVHGPEGANAADMRHNSPSGADPGHNDPSPP